jgi:AraC family transcriptional regulator
MDPAFTHLSPTLLVGQMIRMSFAQDRTRELWQQFMPRRGEVPNALVSDLYSVEVYPSPAFFRSFDPVQPFEKWAAVAVTDHDSVPAGMAKLILPAGRYAVFHYRGDGRQAAPFYQRIYAEWLPQSGFSLDDRPHFARMGQHYRNDDPTSEEEIWIPIK